MTQEQKPQWQRQVAAAIINPAGTTTADKLRLLCEWPILRAWAKSALKGNLNRIPARTIEAYLRDALAWSGHLGDPATLLATQPSQAVVLSPSANHRPTAAGVPTPSAADTTSTAPAPAVSVGSPDGSEGASSSSNPRPTHFDQYRHLVPEELQQRFDDEISDLYLLRTDLATRRDNLSDIVEQAMYASEEKTEDEASAQLAEIAQQLVNVDATIRAFWALVDVAFRYYQLNGVVMTIEDLREQAPVPVDSSAVKRQRAPRTPDHTKEEIEAMPEGEEREAQKAERIRKNAQFLRDKRKADSARSNGGETYAKWRAQVILRAKEMEDWGEPLTAVQQEIVAEAKCQK